MKKIFSAKNLKAALGVTIIINLAPSIAGIITVVCNMTFLKGYVGGFKTMGICIICVMAIVVLSILLSLFYDFLRWCFGYPPGRNGFLDTLKNG